MEAQLYRKQRGYPKDQNKKMIFLGNRESFVLTFSSKDTLRLPGRNHWNRWPEWSGMGGRIERNRQVWPHSHLFYNR